MKRLRKKNPRSLSRVRMMQLKKSNKLQMKMVSHKSSILKLRPLRSQKIPKITKLVGTIPQVGLEAALLNQSKPMRNKKKKPILNKKSKLIANLQKKNKQKGRSLKSQKVTHGTTLLAGMLAKVHLPRPNTLHQKKLLSDKDNKSVREVGSSSLPPLIMKWSTSKIFIYLFKKIII